jgi:hypothetical protein
MLTHIFSLKICERSQVYTCVNIREYENSKHSRVWIWVSIREFENTLVVWAVEVYEYAQTYASMNELNQHSRRVLMCEHLQ